METTLKNQTFFRRTIALPSEHGSWVFILCPLLIGLFAGGRFTLPSLYLVVAAMAAFLIRQPVTIAVKAYSGRRPRRDLPASRFWILLYGLVGLVGLAGLILEGFSSVLILALPGLPVFAWHLYLVSKRAERRQAGIEIVGSGVLALAAPAAFWVGLGRTDPMGWWLFGLTWLQSAASIVYAYLRLEQRDYKEAPGLSIRIAMARRALLDTTFNFTVVLVFALAGILPLLLPLPFAVQWAETIWGTLHPAVRAKPTAIGVRQLIVSTLFTLLFIVTWQLRV